MKHFKWILLFSASCLVISACGSKGGGGSSDSDKSNTISYYESDAQCYKASTNEVVSNSKCDNLKYYIYRGECLKTSDDSVTSISNCTKNSFFLGDDSCYDRSGREVDETRCYENGVPSGQNDSRKRVCSGDHVQWIKEGNYYIPYVGRCDGKSSTGNCSGDVLFDIDEREWVDCL